MADFTGTITKSPSSSDSTNTPPKNRYFKSGGNLYVTDTDGNIQHTIAGGRIFKGADGNLIPTDENGNLWSAPSFRPELNTSSPDQKIGPPASIASKINESLRDITPPLAAGVAAATGSPELSIPAYVGSKELIDHMQGLGGKSVWDEVRHFGDSLTGAGLNEVGGKVLESLPKIGNAAFGKTMRGTFPTDPSILPADKAAMASDDSPRSVGQSTGNYAAKWIEQRFGGKPGAKLANQQRDVNTGKVNKLREMFFPNGVPSDPNGVSSTNLASNYFHMGDSVDAKYDAFRKNYVEPNTHAFIREVPNPKAGQQSTILNANGQPTIEPPTIKEDFNVKGPIVMGEASKYAQSIKDKIDGFVGDENFKNLPDKTRENFGNLKKVIDNLTEGTTISDHAGNKMQVPVKEWEAVKQWRTDIGKVTAADEKIGLAKGTLGKLSSLLGQDIETSVGKLWGSNSADALASLKDANSAHQDWQDVFTPGLRRKIFGRGQNPNLAKVGGSSNIINQDKLADPATLYNGIGKSPEIARQFVSAFGAGKENIAKGSVLGSLLDNATDSANNSFSADKIINQLKAPGYKELYTSAERGNIENFLRQIRTMDPSALSGKRAIGVKEGAFHLTVPALGMLAGHGAGAVALQTGIEISTRQFAQRVLLNPKLARIAAQLPYQAAGSAQGNMLTGQLMKGLSGLVITANINGKEEQQRIDDNGQLVKP